MGEEAKPCRRRAILAQAAPQRESQPEVPAKDAPFAERRAQGYCGTCGLKVGKGRVLHERACRRKRGLPLEC